MSTNLPFRRNLDIDKVRGEYRLPALGTDDKVNSLLTKSVEVYGDLIGTIETITLDDFSKRIKDSFNTPEANDLANQLVRVEPLTLVVFDGDHRDSSKVEYQHTVVRVNIDESEKLIDEIADNEMTKSKYKDGKERRVSVFVGAGGELKSGVFVEEKPEKSLKKTIKNN